jgi:recombinational DNA repair ATPase RecF
LVARAPPQRPLFLLDDVLSELDETSRSHVLSVIKQYQTFITTTGRGLQKGISQFGLHEKAFALGTPDEN